MYELLLSSGMASGANYLPNSGPGTKTLKAGNSTLGYFGEVTTTELFNGWEVAAAAGLETGNEVSTPSTTWFKFIQNGKTLYIPRTQLRLLVSWEELYQKGLVYGTREYGPYPAGAGVSQLVTMAKMENGRQWLLKPRLARGSIVDPQAYPIPQASLDLSEFSLLGHLTPSGAGNVTDKWENFSLGYLGYTSNLQSWVQETLSVNVTSAFYRGDVSGPNAHAYVAKSTKTLPGAAWRPVLELIPDNELKDPFRLYGLVVGTTQPSIKETAPTSDAIINLSNIRQAEWVSKQPVITTQTTSDSIFQTVNITGTTTPTLTPVALSAQGVDLVSNPVNPVWSVTTLNPVALSAINIA
jgi:hypothetical protein